MAIDARTGQIAWKVPVPIPAAGAPAAADGRVFFALGNGKLNADVDAPDGRLWCLSAFDGKPHWEFRAGSSILGSPVVAGDRVELIGDKFHILVVSRIPRKLWS